ncbi:hypothetical protein HMPREF1624_08602 [Sporothrix schenckii ATCC 58251]|uniref:Zn(2)-C6 fungal-type domain-containing protein n=1 Tax=Sporothrix schenckii (strain ATCC 58251 / de Perez 2211183) TaxID=1391915 RepID=U7PKR2_SPOS1|nr:hypothetical protein HMPREF1624_08602 [Sporothrix schenckii ATCC 58251]
MRRAGRSVSRTGCATCRRRKVRCDEGRGVCGNCTRLGIACEWYPAGDIAHRSRIRCTSSASSTGPCAPCQRAMVDCINTNQGIRRGRPAWSGKAPVDAAGMNSPASIRSAAPASRAKPSARPLAPSQAHSASHASHTSHAPMPAPPRPPGTFGPNGNELLPDVAEQRRLVNAYFDGPHYFCFYSFIHPPTLMQLFDNRLVPDFLLLVILATALRFLDPHDRRADAWADECRRLVMLELFSPPSTTTLQALLLLQRFEWHRASHVAAWFLSGLAVRLAHGLQLNLEIAQTAPSQGQSQSQSRSGMPERIPVTVREARRRLIWSCFVMESLIENGRRPLASLDAGAIEVRLPCNEQAFQLGLETDMPTLRSSLAAQEKPSPSPAAPTPTPAPAASVVESRLGISTFLVQLAAMRRAILDYTMPYHPRNKQHVVEAMAATTTTTSPPPVAASPTSPSSSSAPPHGVPWTPGSLFFAYKDQLNRWQERLPPEMRFTAEMLYRRRSSQLVSFVTLHCLYHGCYCDLYRIGSYVRSLHRLSSSSSTSASTSPPADFLADCRRGRVQHALAICRVIQESMRHQPTGHDPVVGISASLALRVLVIERQRDEDALLGVTTPLLDQYLAAAVACGTEIAQRSVPIRDLFYSVCALAKQHGYDVGVVDTGAAEKATAVDDADATSGHRHADRAASPSLRTYGTFGRIQSALACRRDVLAPAASTATDKESDLFQHYGDGARDGDDQPSSPVSPVSPVLPALSTIRSPVLAAPTAALPTESTDEWRLDGPWQTAQPAAQPTVQPPVQPTVQPPPQPYYPYETYSPNEMGVASAWGDGTLNFSMTPTQFDWINQSLGFDFNGSVFGNL